MLQIYEIPVHNPKFSPTSKSPAARVKLTNYEVGPPQTSRDHPLVLTAKTEKSRSETRYPTAVKLKQKAKAL